MVYILFHLLFSLNTVDIYPYCSGSFISVELIKHNLSIFLLIDICTVSKFGDYKDTGVKLCVKLLVFLWDIW